MYTALAIEAVRLQTIVDARRLVHRRAQAGDAHMAVTLGLRLVNVEANAEDARQRMRDRTKLRGAAGLCYGCGGLPVPGRGGRCERCADRQAANLRVWHARNRDANNAKRRAAAAAKRRS